MLHIRKFVERYGPLYSFSCYKFENALRAVKTSVHKPNHVAQQISNRHAERGIIEFKNSPDLGLKLECDTKHGKKVFLMYNLQHATIRCDTFDCYVQIKIPDGILHPVKINYFKCTNGVIHAVYSEIILNEQPFFEFEIDSLKLSSKDFGIISSIGVNRNIKQKEINVKYIKNKYVALPDGEILVLIPYLHEIVS